MADRKKRKPEGRQGPERRQGAEARRAKRRPKRGRRREGRPTKAEKPKAAREPEPKEPARLRAQFDEVIRKKLIEQFGYKNRMEVPRLDKIVLNMGVGEASTTARRSSSRPPISRRSPARRR